MIRFRYLQELLILRDHLGSLKVFGPCYSSFYFFCVVFVFCLSSSYVLCAQCYQCLSCFLRHMSCVPNVTNASPVFYVLCLVCLMLPMPLQLSLWFIFNLEKTDVKKQSDSNLDFKRRHSRCLVSNI